MFGRKDIITAVEIGTSKICVLMGESNPETGLTVVGHGETTPGTGICKGEIVDMNIVTAALADAVDEAERSSDFQIDSDNIYISITGSHIKSQQGTGSVVISDMDRKIKQEHVDEAIQNAKVISLPHDKTAFNTFDSYFILDGDESRTLINPLDQVADKLVAVVHIIYGNRNRINNFKMLFNEIGFDESYPIPVFSGISSAYGILLPQELERGALLIDIGAGTTEYVLINNHGIYHSGILPVGCEHIANDLSLGLELSINICRRMLTDKRYIEHREEGKAMLEVSSSIKGTPRKIPLTSIEKIIDMRIREIFDIIKEDLSNQKLLSKISTSVILTGGVAKIPQASSILKSVFNAPVRIGAPNDVNGIVTDLDDPKYSTVWGLLKYGEKMNQIRDEAASPRFIDKLDRMSMNLIRKISAVKGALRI